MAEAQARGVQGERVDTEACREGPSLRSSRGGASVALPSFVPVSGARGFPGPPYG